VHIPRGIPEADATLDTGPTPKNSGLQGLERDSIRNSVGKLAQSSREIFTFRNLSPLPDILGSLPPPTHCIQGSWDLSDYWTTGSTAVAGPGTSISFQLSTVQYRLGGVPLWRVNTRAASRTQENGLFYGGCWLVWVKPHLLQWPGGPISWSHGA
jgi:hypothetical protein